VAVAAACLVEDLEPVLAIAADVVRAPVFPDADLETRRAELLTSIRQEEDDPGSVAVNRFMSDLYGPHPYGRRVRGTSESVRRLERADLVAFHERWFGPAALIVVVVGALPAPALVEQVSRAFGAWRGGGARRLVEVPDPAHGNGRVLDRIAMPDKAQADVAYGFLGVRRLDARYMAASVMNNALGQYALGGRLGDSIRERQGMAYYVFSSLDGGLGPGPLMIRAGVSADNVERTIASIDFEVAKVVDGGFTAQEIADSKQYMVGSLPRQLETNGGIAGFLLNAELFGLGLDHDRCLPDQIRAVTHDAAIEAARALLHPDHATVVVAGPETPDS
jgi:zinc protease